MENITGGSSGSGSDVKVGIDSGATADYLGAASNDGVLRTSSPLTYTDGGNYITLGTHASLASISGLSYVSGSYIALTAADTYTVRTYAQVLGDIGAQASDASLTSISGLTYVSGSYIALTAADTYTVRTYAQVLSDIGAAASSHAMSTHSDEDSYNISTSGTAGFANATITNTAPATLTITDGTYSHLISASQAEGLAGSDLRIGLDEALRTMIICDRGDIATDFGLAASAEPRLVFFPADAAVTDYTQLYQDDLNFYLAGQQQVNITSNTGNLELKQTGGGGYKILMSTLGRLDMGAHDGFLLYLTNNHDTSHVINLDYTTGGHNKTINDTDAHQAFLRLKQAVNQSGTASWSGIHVNSVITAEGDASTGGVAANALMDFEADSVPLWNVCLEKVTKAHTDDLFDASALTDTSDIFSLPANSILMSCVMVLNTQFAGVTTLKVEVGVTGDDTDGFLLPGAMDLTSDTAASEYSNHGAYWNNAAGTGGFYYVDTATTITALATSTVEDLDQTSAGQVTFYFTYMKLVTTT